MHIGLRVKHPLFLSDFNELNFLDKFSKNTQTSNFMKIRLVGADVFQMDIQTDRPAESNCRAPEITKLKRLGVPLLFVFCTCGPCTSPQYLLWYFNSWTLPLRIVSVNCHRWYPVIPSVCAVFLIPVTPTDVVLVISYRGLVNTPIPSSLRLSCLSNK